VTCSFADHFDHFWTYWFTGKKCAFPKTEVTFYMHSYIKGPTCEWEWEKRAQNLHFEYFFKTFATARSQSTQITNITFFVKLNAISCLTQFCQRFSTYLQVNRIPWGVVSVLSMKMMLIAKMVKIFDSPCMYSWSPSTNWLLPMMIIWFFNILGRWLGEWFII